MKARIQSGPNSVTIHLQGKIDYESQDEVCKLISKALSNRKNEGGEKPIYLSWADVEFVGSAGIAQFVQSVRAIHSDLDCTPNYINVKPEFQKMIKAFEFDYEPPKNVRKPLDQ